MLIRTSEYDVLRAIDDGIQSRSGLMAALDVNVPHTVKNLIAYNLIEKTVQNNSGHVKFFYHLTAAGKAVLNKPREFYQNDSESILNAFERPTASPGEVEELTTVTSSAEDPTGAPEEAAAELAPMSSPGEPKPRGKYKPKGPSAKQRELLRIIFGSCPDQCTVGCISQKMFGESGAKQRENVRYHLDQLKEKGLLVGIIEKGEMEYTLTDGGLDAILDCSGVVLHAPEAAANTESPPADQTAVVCEPEAPCIVSKARECIENALNAYDRREYVLARKALKEALGNLDAESLLRTALAIISDNSATKAVALEYLHGAVELLEAEEA